MLTGSTTGRTGTTTGNKKIFSQTTTPGIFPGVFCISFCIFKVSGKERFCTFLSTLLRIRKTREPLIFKASG